MVPYLVKTLILSVFSFIIIYFYYYTNNTHIENFDGYLPYVITIGIIYGIYKFFQFEFSEKKAYFSIWKIFSYFLLHLFILCILYFSYNNLGLGSGVALFFKIIYYLFIPTLIILISLSFGRKVLSYINRINDESDIYKFIFSLGIGFFSFLFLLNLFGILGFYNLYIVFLILIGFVSFSYSELVNTLKSLFEYKFEFDVEEGNYFKLISTEFLFLVSTLILSISLISIIRPFPIGWDDLGVYMNVPHLMANGLTLDGFGSMNFWLVFTGIGYLFQSPTQAFFINNVGGILSFILLILITSDLLKSKTKTFINIPFLVGTTFISMPMVVFQQAKDMKVDAGLFFVSIIIVYLIFKYYLRLSNKSYLEKIKSFVNDKILHKSFNKSNLLIILLIGILTGFAFGIKLTTLLLISGIIGVMAFARLGILGFLGYLSIYFAIFTKANLWKMMNVTVNPNNIVGFETNFSIISFLIGLVLLIHIVIKNKLVAKKLLMEISVFIIGIILALSPWFIKNIIQVYPNISIGTLLGGKVESYTFDKELILTKEELKIIDDAKEKNRISEKGTTTNEDLGRYFGYETGANNYLKLPWNLTMQRNQGGEFTDIGFIFLALLPVILLFLPYRKKYYPFFIVLVLIFELLVFIKVENDIIGSEYIINLSENTKSIVFEYDKKVLEDKSNNKDIYDIELGNYVSEEEIKKLITTEYTLEYLKDRVKVTFYQELSKKVLNNELGKDLALTQTELSDKDFEFIKELRLLKEENIKFKPDINSIDTLNSIISKNNLSTDKKELIRIWKDNRSFNQFTTDWFSSFNLPLGYPLILFFFLLPVLLLIYGIDNKKEKESYKMDLFKLNLVFACFYTFLWTISAFGIVWYGITMYFSFLLIIAIGTFYISSYESEENEKEYYIKLFGTLVFALVFVIYIVNSVFPHSFNNLKKAGYDKYKTGDITIVNAPYVYHTEYLKILFNTNINQDKKDEFLNEFITEDIKKAFSGIEKMDIFSIRYYLNDIIKKNKSLEKSAKISLNNIYKNISNPSQKYKSSVGIYRIGTFLKYHISENNKRILEDGLLFNFNDYIYNPNITKTVENFKKLNLGYLLVDLNAATIDKDSRHDLTKRYEKLLSIFTSDKLELVETDSLCLKLALEDFNKSEKLSDDRKKYLTIAGINHESYTEEGEQIGRGTKLLKCYNRIYELIDSKVIDNKNYNYLLGINNHIVKNKDKLNTKKKIYLLIKQQVTHGYKVLFKIK